MRQVRLRRYETWAKERVERGALREERRRTEAALAQQLDGMRLRLRGRLYTDSEISRHSSTHVDHTAERGHSLIAHNCSWHTRGSRRV
eukprot:2563311-Prymnesium_polylepis.2